MNAPKLTYEQYKEEKLKEMAEARAYDPSGQNRSLTASRNFPEDLEKWNYEFPSREVQAVDPVGSEDSPEYQPGIDYQPAGATIDKVYGEDVIKRMYEDWYLPLFK